MNKQANRLHGLGLLLLASVSATLFAADAPGGSVVSKQARALHERILTLDTHFDTTEKLDDPKWNVLDRHPVSDSQIDYPRMVEGGLDGGFWVIYTPQRGRTTDAYREARDNGLRRLIHIHELVAAHPDKFELALTAADARRIEKAGKRFAFISIENASPLTSDPVSLLRFYYSQGVRLLGLVHTTNNEFADSATDEAVWNGVSPAGRELIEEANRLGIVLDQSHASDTVFDQLIQLSRAPFILSHSSAKDVFAHARNIDDARLRKLAAKGGVIQVNSLGSYLVDTGLTPDARREQRELQQKFAGLPAGAARDKAVADARAEFNRKYNVKEATIDDYLRHLDHILQVVGPDHVGFGADWDGGGGVKGFEDITALPKLTQWLLDKGYTEQQIANIWGGNVLRVLDEAQKVAAQLQAAVGTPVQR